MWKLLKADFMYLGKSLIGVSLILVLFILAEILYSPGISDKLQGLLIGFLSGVLFIPQIMNHQEKRNGLFRLMPVTPNQVAKQRILFAAFEIILIIIFLIIIESNILFSNNTERLRLFAIVGTIILILSGFFLLRDKWLSFFEKKQQIISIIKYSALYVLPLIGILFFIRSYFSQENTLYSIPKEYILAAVFIFFAIAIFNRSISSYMNRKSYLD